MIKGCTHYVDLWGRNVDISDAPIITSTVHNRSEMPTEMFGRAHICWFRLGLFFPAQVGLVGPLPLCASSGQMAPGARAGGESSSFLLEGLWPVYDVFA